MSSIIQVFPNKKKITEKPVAEIYREMNLFKERYLLLK